jgi:hypothetical protein
MPDSLTGSSKLEKGIQSFEIPNGISADSQRNASLKCRSKFGNVLLSRKFLHGEWRMRNLILQAKCSGNDAHCSRAGNVMLIAPIREFQDLMLCALYRLILIPAFGASTSSLSFSKSEQDR